MLGACSDNSKYPALPAYLDDVKPSAALLGPCPVCKMRKLTTTKDLVDELARFQSCYKMCEAQHNALRSLYK